MRPSRGVPVQEQCKQGGGIRATGPLGGTSRGGTGEGREGPWRPGLRAGLQMAGRIWRG